MSNFIPGNQLAKIITKDGKTEIHHIVGWNMTARGYGVPHPVIPTRLDTTPGEIVAIGTHTPEGVLWSLMGCGLINDNPIYRTYRVTSKAFGDDGEFGGF